MVRLEMSRPLLGRAARNLYLDCKRQTEQPLGEFSREKRLFVASTSAGVLCSTPTHRSGMDVFYAQRLPCSKPVHRRPLLRPVSKFRSSSDEKRVVDDRLPVVWKL